MKNFFKTIWDAIEKKGRLTTIMSLVLAAPINIHATIIYFKDPTFFTEDRLVALAILNALAWFWCIMPSRVKVSGPKINIEIED